MSLLAKDRTQRPQSAREVAKAIVTIERRRAEKENSAVPSNDAGYAHGKPKDRTAASVSMPEDTRKEDARPAARPKAARKGRPVASQRKKRRDSRRDLGRQILFASMVLLAVAIVVLIIGIYRFNRRSHDTAPAPPSATASVSPFSVGSGIGLPQR
jgi:hypothetical protein